MKQLFTDHPATVGETYGQHMGSALSFAGPLFVAACCCLVHAVLPFVFEKTASGKVQDLYRRMVTNRHSASNIDKAPDAETAFNR